MPFVKGKSGNPKGRALGKPNHFTNSVRDTVLEVFKMAQEDPELCLLQFLRDNPRDFYALAGKLVPTAINAEIRTPDGIKIEFISADDCKPIGNIPEPEGQTDRVHPRILGEQTGL
jgi:hypothetical protein